MKTQSFLPNPAWLVLGFMLAGVLAWSQPNLLIQQAALSRLGNSWTVTECCGWTGTWTRQGTSNLFNATWRHTNGTVVKDVVELVSWNTQTQEVIIRRASLNGQYKATYNSATKQLVNGSATWYPAGATWSATISDVVILDDEKGEVKPMRK